MSADRPVPKAIKGRGAVSAPQGRFESLREDTFDDGWLREEELAAPLETIVKAETARSIISRNDSPDIPFAQSINPYRGCEHGCVYCLSGDTPILMADGTTRAIADLRAGDDIYGTVREGWFRRYRPTRVLAHWSVIRQAYRVTLQDGTALVCGPDHRFLTERGWKYATPGGGGAQRPYLTRFNKLMGTGAFAGSAPKNRRYLLGYLCGLIRGDGSLGEYRYARPARAHGDQFRFRLALCDRQALVRAQRYLFEFEVAAQAFLFAEARPGRRRMEAIRTSSRSNVALIRELITWPDDAPAEWSWGFLAGIFDAEGSYSGGILRISNTDEEIVARIRRCLEAFGFRFAIERAHPQGRKPVQTVRILGGLREHLRFFHGADPAITRKRDITGQAIKSEGDLQVVGIEPLGKAMRLFDITTGTGDFIANGVVSHNCYARPTHSYVNLSPGLDFETKLFYKRNAAELLEKELSKPGYRPSMIALGASTDPYQPIEREYKVTREILEVLLRFRHPVGITTKGVLVSRDIDLLAEMARLDLVHVAMSITSLQPELKRTLEPRAAGPQARLRVVRELSDAGVPTMVMFSPVIPFVNDAELESVLEAARAAGARGAGFTMLRLPWEVKDLFVEWLQVHAPLKADHVMSLVEQMRGGKAYDSQWGTRMRGTGQYAQMIEQRFRLTCRRLGLNKDRWDADVGHFRVPPKSGDQISLFS